MSFPENVLYDDLYKEYLIESEAYDEADLPEVDIRLLRHYSVYDYHWQILDNLNPNTLLKPTKVDWAKEGF